jgi:hypothetical protein
MVANDDTLAPKGNSGQLPATSRLIEGTPHQNGVSLPAGQREFLKNDHIITTATFDGRLRALSLSLAMHRTHQPQARLLSRLCDDRFADSGVIVDRRKDDNQPVEYFIHYDHCAPLFFLAWNTMSAPYNLFVIGTIPIVSELESALFACP